MKTLGLDGVSEKFDGLIDDWHADEDCAPDDASTLHPLAYALARRNFLLWHEEDKARRRDVDDTVIALVKRNIDGFNQQRNDFIEKLDEAILEHLSQVSSGWTDQPINSETPGSIVDRISIMSLKIYHMREDTQRTDIDEDHRLSSQRKLAILIEQRRDLETALQQLILDLRNCTRRMKVYRQFKMYNDPALNPEIYKRDKK